MTPPEETRTEHAEPEQRPAPAGDRSSPDHVPDYEDIPGTYVFNGRRSRAGYPLNMMAMSLNHQANRDAFTADSEAYMERFQLSPEQRQAVRDRDYLAMLRLGGNIYFIHKLAVLDGLTLQHVGGDMSGITVDEFRAMMLHGGRPIEGNRTRAEWAARPHPERPTGLDEYTSTNKEGRA